MRSTIGFSKSVYKTGIACLLALSLCIPSAFGLSFFSRKKPQAEHIPPASDVSPNMINPGGDQASPASNNTETPAPPPRPALNTDDVSALVKKGIFPADSTTRTTPFNRAELASILVKALGHNTELVSEFPFYRDVSKDYWAYAPIEVAREKKLIEHSDGHGFYHPEEIVTYADVYTAIAQAITGPMPSEEATEFLLKSFKDKADIAPEVAPAAAKMARVRFFSNRAMPEARRTLLNANDSVYPEGLAPHVSYLMRLITRQAPLRAEVAETLPVLPAGLSLSVSPATAIFEARLGVGEAVYLTLAAPAGPLPKGSRIRGQVREARTNERTYIADLFEARTPQGEFYQTSAELTLKFPPKEKLAFFVPGETFEVVTKLPETEETITTPTPTDASQSAPADNKTPSFAPPAVKQPTPPIQAPPATNAPKPKR